MAINWLTPPHLENTLRAKLVFKKSSFSAFLNYSQLHPFHSIAMDDREIEAYTAPNWLSTRQATKDADLYFRDAILFHLSDSSPKTVLQYTRKTSTAESLSECSYIYNLELYKLLKKKGIDIPEEENEYEYIDILLTFLFPDIWEDM